MSDREKMEVLIMTKFENETLQTLLKMKADETEEGYNGVSKQCKNLIAHLITLQVIEEMDA